MNVDNMPAGTISAVDTFLAQLRSATAESHKNLESLPVSASILSPTVSRESYAHYLKLMRDVIFETENTIFPLLQNVIPNLDELSKLHSIDSDLHFLNAENHSNRAVFTKNKSEFSQAFALGILYVVEGSSLGGRVILKNINAVLGYDENLGAKYFAGYGNKTGSHWKTFLNHLTTFEVENNCGEEIIAGADFAFQAIHDHFASHPQA